MVDINREINRLINYGIQKGLIEEDDIIYTVNKLISLLKKDTFANEIINENIEEPTPILNNILEYLISNNEIDDNMAARDIYEAKIMDCLMPRPSVIKNKFWNYYHNTSKEAATNYYYQLSKDSNYIKTKSIAKNITWKAEGDFGEYDITINLSKPEKDPKVIAMQKNIVSSSDKYPTCLLCKENEGYLGRIDHPGRSNHRIIPMNLSKEKWYLQYSPYSYFNEHGIVFNAEHTPMAINKTTFTKLLDFVDVIPHYIVGTNADLPIVGGSILSHDHYQCGNYSFPMENVKEIYSRQIDGFNDVKLSVIEWPMSVIKLNSSNKNRIIELADYILDKWRNYSDDQLDIINYTENPHNTITPIVRYLNNEYVIYLVLRNNRINNEFPDGIFHPHQDVHHIKKENIGLIEVMGVAILPGRLKHELDLLKSVLLEENNINTFKELKKHHNWYLKIKENYVINSENIDDIIKKEVTMKFERCLIDAGVFKELDGFKKFINSL